MSNVIDVKSLVNDEKELLKGRVDKLKNKGIVPKLAVILANDDESSRIYVGRKRKMCQELGIEEEEYIFDEAITSEHILNLVYKLNKDDSIDGILVQLPLFKHLDETNILNAIDPKKDVDGFHPVNLGNLLINLESMISCTPKGIMKIIDSLGESLVGKKAVVVGRSRIVGKPIACLLLNRGATVTICHSKTKDLANHTKEADVLVVATGRPHLITSDMVKQGSIVIDVGINRVDGKIVGDVDTENVSKIAKNITPVPGGVGLTTVLSLMENVVEVAEKKI